MRSFSTLMFFVDDVAHIGIAMGTPGDKTNIGKVVETKLHQQTEQEQQGISLPGTDLSFQHQPPGLYFFISH